MTMTTRETPPTPQAIEEEPKPAPDTAVRRLRRRLLRNDLTGWAFVAPAMIIILGLSIFPAVWAFILSLQEWNGFAPPEFIGGDNYSQLMSDAEFWDAVTHTGVYVVLFV